MRVDHVRLETKRGFEGDDRAFGLARARHGDAKIEMRHGQDGEAD